ncbi:hypothetical protein HOLleu_06940 [Holothuria leucospilota]|uniref:Uncharacterized protein n=1 Tax=Holothuria leucospilota TaxID=206669 RepID=A0A9Q1CM49_HOLLE|nr:hypothetical protein HOLleu_06940 [Holothuria leucospilota]
MDVQRRRKRICAVVLLQIHSEESELQNFAVLQNTTGILPILASTFRRGEVPRVRGFIENTVQRYDDLDFKFHFRLDRCTSDILINYLGNSNIRTPETYLGGTPALTLKKQLLMFLWFVGR